MSRNDRVKKWRNKTKERIIAAFGGKCCCCGYSKCQNALELHHLNPSEKEFSLCSVRANPKKWSIIVQELRKCCLVCSNCHREVHAGVKSLPCDIPKFNEIFSNYKEIEKEQKFNNCPVCGGRKAISLITCSLKCAAQRRNKYDWAKHDIYLLHCVKKLNNCQIAEIIGCSDAAVIKGRKKMGIYKRY